MKITIICDVLGEENNGTSKAAMNLIRAMKEREHIVRVVCPDKDKAGLPGFYITGRYNFGIFNGYVEKNGVTVGRADEELIRRAMSGADVVHLLVPFSLSICAVKLAQEMKIPVTASFHCQAENITSHVFMKNFKPANKMVYKLFYDNVYKYCDSIHYPSEFICRTFERIVGPTHHYVISNGVSGDFEKRPAEKPEALRGKFVILFTGRYSKEKSHKVLIDAAAKSRHADDLRLIFAGSGPQEENLRRYAEKTLKYQPIFGFYDREELIDVINYSDLYVHPAEIEIEAISCLEAISCGRIPVISNSRRSATRAFALTDKNLFECNNPDDLAAKIDFWYENPIAREKCEKMYLGYASQFNYEVCMDKMQAMFEETAKIEK